jgi:hypothetical protein
MRQLIALISLAVLGGGCTNDFSGETEPVTQRIAKVGVSADGQIELNGAVASIEDIRATFAGLARDNGVVWYYREAASGEPHPNAMLVVQAVVEARLPISMSTKPDFSDVVLADGTTKAR